MNYDFIQILLISLIFLSVLVEFKTGGTGLGALMGIVAAGIFWSTSYIAGQFSLYLIILFIIGVIFIFVEILTPSIGIFALLGIISILYSFVQAIGGDINAIFMLFIAIVISIVIFVLIIKYLPESRCWNKIVLKKTSSSVEGYVSTQDKSSYLNKKGIVNTELRPSGTVIIDNKLLDVVSEGGFIPKGTFVEVIYVEGNRIVVRKLQ